MSKLIKLKYEIEVRDKLGKVKHHEAKDADTLLSNFGEFFDKSVFKLGSVGYYGGGIPFTVKDVFGTDHTLPINANSSFVSAGEEGFDLSGLIVGAGNTPVTYSDYRLKGKIPHSGNYLYYYAQDIATEIVEGQFVVSREFENRNGIGYGPNILVNGTVSADTGHPYGFVPYMAVDGLDQTRWSSDGSPMPHWLKYDLGVGVTKIVRKIRLLGSGIPGDGDPGMFKDFTLQGSNDDSTWDDLYSGTQINTPTWQEYTFANSTAYRYYRVLITSTYRSDAVVAILGEVQMMEYYAAPVSIEVKEIGLMWMVLPYEPSGSYLFARDIITTATLSPSDILNAKYIFDWLP
jgi:hypothetical protein